MSAVVIPLTTKDVKAHGEIITVLNLPEPNGELIMELGLPFLVHAEGQMELRPKVAGAYAFRLGKVPLSTIKSLNAPDILAVQAAVMSFFGKSMDDLNSSSSSSPSTSPDSGD